jgi:hypothetical protein
MKLKLRQNRKRLQKIESRRNNFPDARSREAAG